MHFKKYRPWNPDQLVLFPPAMRDSLPEDHIVFRLIDVVESLDISCITDRIHEKDPRGTRPYNPRMMLILLIYAYFSGIYSSRKIAAATYDIIPFRVVAADQHPHFTVISKFRLIHLEAFIDLFLQVLELCDRAGLIDLKHVSLDGSKFNANANKHKAMSYGRMETEVERLEKEIREFSEKAAKIDAEEDERLGKNKEAHEIDEELKRRDKRLKAIKIAKAELEQEALRAREKVLRERAEHQARAAETEADPVEKKRQETRSRKANEEADRLAEQQDDDFPKQENDGPDSDLPTHQIQTTTQGTPRPEAQRNFTDPNSKIMKRDGEIVQAFNDQIVVDEANQIIIAEAVTNQSPDQEHLVPLMNRAIRNLGKTPEILSADCGYMSKENVEYCENMGIDAHIAVERDKHGKAENSDKAKNENEVWQAMRAKLTSEEGKKIYSRRKVIVEPVFGNIKEPRRFRRFSLRGLKKIRREFTLVCLCHNIHKLLLRATETEAVGFRA